MRYLKCLLGLLLFVVVILFTFKNTAPVSIQFIAERYLVEVPLALALYVAFLLGIVVTFLFGLPRRFGSFYERSHLKDENQRLKSLLTKAEQDLAQLKETTALTSTTESSAPTQNG